MSDRFRNGERGSVTPFFAVAVVAILITAGLVADGGAKVRAVQRADRFAAEAARAGGQSINIPAAVQAGQVRVDPAAAVRAAQHYLRAAGVIGTATVTGGGAGMHVTTTLNADTVFLGLIGIHQINVTGNADVTLIHSVTGEQP